MSTNYEVGTIAKMALMLYIPWSGLNVVTMQLRIYVNIIPKQGDNNTTYYRVITIVEYDTGSYLVWPSNTCIIGRLLQLWILHHYSLHNHEATKVQSSNITLAVQIEG